MNRSWSTTARHPGGAGTGPSRPGPQSPRGIRPWGCGLLLAAPLLLAGCTTKPAAVATKIADGPRISGPVVVPGEPTLRLDLGTEAEPRAVFLVEGLDAADLDLLSKAELDRESWLALFAVRVADGPADAPPLLGRHLASDGAIRFEPRFPPEPGLRYRATFDPARLPGRRDRPATGTITSEFEMAPRPESPPTVVSAVYPSRAWLPENQLKLYVHFSAPMARGGAYAHIRLLDDAHGRPVDLPFLEIDQELWDARQTRLTLLFDPARVKRGLASREEAGLILEDGKSYTLVIDRSWEDAAGRPLREAHRKTFRVGPPDETPIDPRAWTIAPPAAGTAGPLVVTFPEPLDHALLGHAIRVLGPDQFPRRGRILIDAEETRWSFMPDAPWQAGDHALLVDTELEDLAGNAVGRPFEIDVFQKIDRAPVGETVRVPFAVE